MHNVSFDPPNRRGKKLGSALLLAIFSLTLVGCEVSRETICQDLPLSQTELAAIRGELGPRYTGRRIASESARAPREQPAQDQIDAWMKWTEKALKKTQWAQDAFENETAYRKVMPSLNSAGLSLVSLHGYLEQGKWRKAAQALHDVEENLKSVNDIACKPVDSKSSEPKRSPASTSKK